MDLGLRGKRAIVTSREELPAGRIAEPEEIGNVVTFLTSEACSYMFGSALYMDGGKRRATP